MNTSLGVGALLCLVTALCAHGQSAIQEISERSDQDARRSISQSNDRFNQNRLSNPQNQFIRKREPLVTKTVPELDPAKARIAPRKENRPPVKATKPAGAKAEEAKVPAGNVRMMVSPAADEPPTRSPKAGVKKAAAEPLRKTVPEL